MLSLAIATTLVGFALLVVGLITGQVWFAIACIAICLIGVGLLVADVLRSGRAAKASVPDRVTGDPLADLPVREPAVRAVGPYRPAPDAARSLDVVTTGPVPAGSVESTWPAVAEPGPPASAVTAARVTDDSTATTEGSFNDYVAATTGEFAATPAAPAPAGDQRSPDPVPGVGNGVRWESSIPPQQSEFIDRSASNWSTSGWATSPRPDDAAENAVGPDDEPSQPRARSRHRGSAGASGMPKFDPLDPNWHPPAD